MTGPVRQFEELRLDDADAAARWERTLDRHGVANRYLRPAWVALYARAYSMPVRAFGVAVADGDLALVLPVVRVRSMLFGDTWISLPFVTSAGAWWDPKALAPEAASETLAAIAAALGRPLDLRGGDDAPPAPGAPAGADKAVYRMKLPEDAEALWQALPPPRRRQIKRAEKAGYRVDEGGAELLPAFHGVYSETMRDLGSPPHSMAFFALALQALGPHGRVLAAFAPDGAPAAAGLAVRHGARLEVPWVGALRRFRGDAPNQLLYHRAMVHGIAAGCAEFDFGRSTVGSGQAAFKLQWGAGAAPVRWTRVGGTERPRTLTRPGRAAGLVSAVWMRLPLWAVRALGPHLIRRIPA
jgi:FemAB-related protein (PEP-CTERM system-associated)